MSDLRHHVSELPLLSTTSGIGGQLRTCPEDFLVEEIPLYEASGEGEHVFLQIEKRDLTTQGLVELLARSLRISERDIGVAGRKDAFAVTRQFVSVPRVCIEETTVEWVENRILFERQPSPGQSVRVLFARAHQNKLKTGHLSGNRFEVVVRDLEVLPEEALSITAGTREQIEQSGFPNYFGEQRFGARNDSDAAGFQLLRGERTRRLNRNALRFAISAAQSRLFNFWAANRVGDGLAREVLAGDVMQVTESKGCFVVEAHSVAAEQDRFDCRETVLTGPMFGPRMKNPDGAPADREMRVLEAANLRLEAFSRFRKLSSGTRRPLLIWPGELQIQQWESSALKFEFVLPAGVFATSLLREFLKSATS